MGGYLNERAVHFRRKPQLEIAAGLAYPRNDSAAYRNIKLIRPAGFVINTLYPVRAKLFDSLKLCLLRGKRPACDFEVCQVQRVGKLSVRRCRRGIGEISHQSIGIF